MNSNIASTVLQIIQILSTNEKMNFLHPNLPKFAEGNISTSLGNIYPLLTSYRSILPDKFPNLILLKQLVDQLGSTSSIFGLDHIGFCYKTESSLKEKERLIKIASRNSIPIYEEPSNDDGLWLFAGNITQINAPVIEFVPIENTTDTDKEYWLPHIQLDIDTILSSEDILDIIKNIYGNEITPFSFVINGTTYIIRCRLGIVEGINIFLDLATSSRNVTHLRQYIWQKIV